MYRHFRNEPLRGGGRGGGYPNLSSSTFFLSFFIEEGQNIYIGQNENLQSNIILKYQSLFAKF